MDRSQVLDQVLEPVSRGRDVQNGHVRCHCLDKSYGRLTLLGLTDNPDVAVPLEKCADPLADELSGVDNDNSRLHEQIHRQTGRTRGGAGRRLSTLELNTET